MPALLAGYIRVSHVGARAADRFHSPDEQTREIEAWARARGVRVEMLPAELDGKGSDAARPIFRQAVDGVIAGKYAGVVVAYLSRAGRDLRLMLDLWAEVEAVGGSVYSARENIDATTASGRLQRNLLASIAQHELEERRDGFDRARAGAVERGIWQRRQTPLGYGRDPQTRRLVADDGASLVASAFHARAAGQSISSLARRLEMTPSGTRQLLRNEVYLGRLRVGAHVNLAAHPALVDEETFAAAQRTQPRPARVRGCVPALLAGLVRCSGCGHVMTRGGSAARAVYTCPARHSGESCPAPAAITCALLDSHVEPIALAELARLAVSASDGDGVERARAQVAAAQRELAAYLEAVSAADVGAEAFGAGARARREQLDAARDALEVQRARRPAAPFAGTGADAWHDLDGAERNALLRALLGAVIVARGGGRGSRTSLADRTRVIAHGAPLTLPVRRGGEASGIVPLPLPDLHDPGVLGPAAGQDRLERGRGAGQVGRRVAAAA
jgi:DNA invertase Pin-like site-specific DNA recombinase